MEYTDTERLDFLLDELFTIDDTSVAIGDNFKPEIGVCVDTSRVDKIFKPRHIEEDWREVIDRAIKEVR